MTVNPIAVNRWGLFCCEQVGFLHFYHEQVMHYKCLAFCQVEMARLCCCESRWGCAGAVGCACVAHRQHEPVRVYGAIRHPNRTAFGLSGVAVPAACPLLHACSQEQTLPTNGFCHATPVPARCFAAPLPACAFTAPSRSHLKPDTVGPSVTKATTTQPVVFFCVQPLCQCVHPQPAIGAAAGGARLRQGRLRGDRRHGELLPWALRLAMRTLLCAACWAIMKGEAPHYQERPAAW